ncbi:NRAMP family divalent metal transporter [Micromonospora sp. NPDC093277]|uniref:NRAMP family divalent metal transporter n=1 Tax=Micromonospora sp. NPDC093277 TaxID=3364291 RepID=UPI00380F70C9
MTAPPSSPQHGGGRGRLLVLTAGLGNGLVAAVSDVDPTTVGTMSVIGSTTGYSLAWLTVLLIPLVAGVLTIASRISVVTGHDLQGLVVLRYGRPARLLLLVSIVAVNLFTLAADVAAGGAALELLTGVGWRIWTLPLAAAVLVLLLAGAFHKVQRLLQYVMLVLIAFGVAAVLARPDWHAVARGTFVPALPLDKLHITSALALLGTTLTSYVYVWQSISHAEERPPVSRLRFQAIQSAAAVVVAVAIFWFIQVATAATLGREGTKVETSEQAARALEPVAGPGAAYLFAIGMLASTLLALPILAASTGYIVGAEFGWRRGLSQPARHAPRFYLVLALTLALSVAAVLSGLDPIRLLFLASLAGGIGTPISLAFLIKLARDPRVMGAHRIPGWLAGVGWGLTAAIAAISVVFLATGA